MLCYQNIVFKMVALLGSDPWTSGKRLILWRFWVLIPAPYTGWTVFSLFGCKMSFMFAWQRTKINKKESGDGPLLPLSSILFVYQKSYLRFCCTWQHSIFYEPSGEWWPDTSSGTPSRSGSTPANLNVSAYQIARLKNQSGGQF